MNIFSSAIQTLENTLSATALKQKTHSANIANVDTPNYKSKQVDFQTALHDAATKQSFTSYRTNEKHIPFGSESQKFDPRVLVNNSTEVKANGNNVDMDVEMAEVAKNQLLYNAATERISGKFRSLGSVINGGR